MTNITPFPRRKPALAVVKADQAPRDCIQVRPRKPAYDVERRAYAAEKLGDAVRIASVVFDRDELVELLQTHIAGQVIIAQREARS